MPKPLAHAGYLRLASLVWLCLSAWGCERHPAAPQAAGPAISPWQANHALARLAFSARGRVVAPETWAFDDLGDLLVLLASDATGPTRDPASARFIAFGELHTLATDDRQIEPALEQFRRLALPRLTPMASDLILETWTVDKTCRAAKAGTQAVEAMVQRPAHVKRGIVAVTAAASASMKVHGMKLPCHAWATLVRGTQVDAEQLLAKVTSELLRLGKSSWAYRRRRADPRHVMLYGGALHNDLSPAASLADWSIGPALARFTVGRYIEIDLVVRRYAARDESSKRAPWFRLLGVAPDRYLLWQRAPDAYTILLADTQLP